MIDRENADSLDALRAQLTSAERDLAARLREMAELEARILRFERRPTLTSYAPALGSGLLATLRGYRRFRADKRLLLGSPLFDSGWYREQYAEFPAADADPAADYLIEGWARDRNPGPRFSTASYLDRYHDVARAGINPLVHYLRFGAAEGSII